MPHLAAKKNELLIKLDVEQLTPVQVRLLKSINALLTNVMTAEEEAEYFESSAELLRHAAEFIKAANYPKSHRTMDYAEQAVEYAVDFLNERTAEKDSLDN